MFAWKDTIDDADLRGFALSQLVRIIYTDNKIYTYEPLGILEIAIDPLRRSIPMTIFVIDLGK